MTEFRVNTETFGDQINPQTAVLSDDTIVVAWQSPDGSGDGVYMNRLYPNMTKMYSEIRINTVTFADQVNPQIAVLSDDTIVVAWESPDGSADGVYMNRLYPNMTKRYTETKINTETFADQVNPQIAVLSDETMVVVWESPDGSADGVYATKVNFTELQLEDVSTAVTTAFTMSEAPKTSSEITTFATINTIPTAGARPTNQHTTTTTAELIASDTFFPSILVASIICLSLPGFEATSDVFD